MNKILCEATISAEESKRLHAMLYEEVKEELEKLARWRLKSLHTNFFVRSMGDVSGG